MLNAKEMQKTITDMVRETLRGSRFEGIRIAPEDDDEDIERPSIKLTTDTKYAKEMLIKISDTTADIFFYAEKSDDYIVDCLEMQELLENKLTEGIEADGEILQPDNVDCSTSGGILAISFTLEQMEPVVNEGEPEMESLVLNIK